MKEKKLNSFSIIITSYEYSDLLFSLMQKYQSLSYDKYEIILVTESKDNGFEKIMKIFTSIKFRIIKTDEILPGKKRHLAALDSKNDYLCFIDDDAYPTSNWLETANSYINNSGANVFGGISICPKKTSSFEKMIYTVNSFKHLSGNYLFFNNVGIKKVEELPSVNLFIKKEIYFKINGFNNIYWPGEDTYLCNEITKKNIEIFYNGNIQVYHHMRSNIVKYFKQVSNYAKTRGFFFKKLNNSLKIKFLIPSIFLIYLIFSILINFISFKIFTLIPLLIYFILIIFGVINKLNSSNSFLITIKSSFVLFFTHLVYGVFFIKGLLSKKYVSDLKR